MKKLCILFAFSVLLSPAFALNPTPSPAPLKASSILFPVGPNKQMISLEDLAYMKPRDFAKVSGQHMNLFQRAGFSMAQKKLRGSINDDGTINNKQLSTMVAPMLDGDTGFHIGGFALGFLLGLIGVLIAYLIKDDYSANRRKWAWIGFGSFVVIYVLLLLLAA